MTSRSNWQPALTWLLLLAFTTWVLLPGLSGGFLFDDFPNLKPLGDLGGVVDFETLKAYVLSGSAGPTGRPIAILSFLLDANDWPADPAAFKRTNLLVHLLVFCVLTATLLEFLRNLGWKEENAQWIAILAAGFWALHPFMVSTTFYVVQRMAQLATLFVLAGIWGYLYGRRFTSTQPVLANIFMAGSLGICTILATLSKENGALLPLLALVLEVLLPKNSARPKGWLRWTGLYIPSAVLILYLLSQIDFSPTPWMHRPFNQPERLLSESRILLDYLSQLFIPGIEGAGLFRDGFQISRGVFNPPQTLLSLITLSCLVLSAWVARKRFPLYSAAILFFLASHLIESTVIGLELYFEHRNYLAATFLFLPVASMIHELGQRISRFAMVATALTVSLLLAFLTHERATLWGDTEKLTLYWAFSAPDSPRAQQEIISHLLDNGEQTAAIARMNQTLKTLPNNSYLQFYNLLVRLRTGLLNPGDFDTISDSATQLHFDAQSLLILRALVGQVEKYPANDWRKNALLNLLHKLDNTPRFSENPLYRRLSPYLKARIQLSRGRPEVAEQLYLSASRQQLRVSATLRMVAEMASAGEIERALRLLSEAETLLQSNTDSSATRQKSRYLGEITRLRNTLLQEKADMARPASHLAHPATQ